MSKRLTAALIALLTFAAVLAAVPLASPAAAHPQTTTKQYCAYDPFAGNQCWTETVSVAHHHPPANQSCPAGTTGTPPNCLPIPSDNTNNAGNQDGNDQDGNDPGSAEDPDGNDPDATENPDGDDPDPAEDPDGDEPTTQPQPVTCGQGEHRYGTGCHAHSFVAPCGDGTWVPHTGHTPIQQKPCPTQQDLKAITYTVTPCTPHQDPLEAYQRHKHTLGNGNDETECHRADTFHCPAGHTETGGHGSQNCVESEVISDLQRVAGLIRVGTVNALNTARDIINKIAEDHGESALSNAKIYEAAGEDIAQEIQNLWDKTPAPVQNLIVGLSCVGLVAIAAKTIVASGGAAAPAWVKWAGSGVGAAVAIECQRRIMALIEGDVDSENDESDSENGDSPEGDSDAPADPNAPDNTDYTYDDGAYARKMCTEYSVEYFCSLISANEQNGGQ